MKGIRIHTKTKLLGYPGLEPETSPLSGARSTTELIARVNELEQRPLGGPALLYTLL